MPQSTRSGATDTSGSAQGRFTVQLPAELRPALERHQRRISEAVEKETGIGIEVSLAQVVQTLIKQADRDAQAGSGS